MENNQFNPQAGQPNQAPQQGQPMGQQPQQFAQPQQGQPMGQQPQQFAQPQQGQPMGQQPMQGQPMGQRPGQPMQGQPMGQRPGQPMQGQPMGQRPGQFAQTMPQVAPKAPMSMEKRTLFIGISLLVVAVVLFTLSPIKNRYYDNSAIGTFNSIFNSIFTVANFAFLVVTSIVGALLFVPKWSKQFLDYANARLVVLATAGTAAILSLLHFIMILTHTIQANGLYSDVVKRFTENSGFYAPEVFKFDFISLPIALALSVVALFLALPLLKKQLKKDRFILGLVIVSITLLVALLFIFIFFFLGKAGIAFKPYLEVSKYLG